MVSGYQNAATIALLPTASALLINLLCSAKKRFPLFSRENLQQRCACLLDRSRSSDERIIGRLAQFTCYSGAVASFRQLSRSSISPCEQVGEHHGGAGSCLASGRGAPVSGPGQLTEAASWAASCCSRWPATSGASSPSVSRLVFVCMGSRLLLRLSASLRSSARASRCPNASASRIAAIHAAPMWQRAPDCAPPTGHAGICPSMKPAPGPARPSRTEPGHASARRTPSSMIAGRDRQQLVRIRRKSAIPSTAANRAGLKPAARHSALRGVGGRELAPYCAPVPRFQRVGSLAITGHRGMGAPLPG